MKRLQIYFFLLLVFTLFSTACKNDDEDNSIDPPIMLCEELGLGNLDPNKAGGDSYTLKNNPDAPIDYIISCFFWVVDLNLEIEPGTVIEFEDEAGILVRDGASLSAVGSNSSPILLRGTNAAKGWWRGIGFDGSDVRNELNFVTIDGAGGRNIFQGGGSYAIDDRSEGLKIRNCIISNSGNDGYTKAGLSPLGIFSNNNISNCDGYPVYIHANLLHQLDGTASTYTGNLNNMIKMAITGGSVITITTEQSWKAQGIPVIMDEGTLGIRSDLTIEPGFDLIMRPDCAIVVNDEGSLNAQGTMTAPIIFRGEEDIPGYWESFFIEGSNTANRLDYVTIANGGRLKPFGAAPQAANLYIGSGTDNLTISNTTINKSLECGIFLSNNTSVTFNNIIYSENAGEDLCEE